MTGTATVTAPETGPPARTRHPGRDDARRFALACAAGGALAMVVMAWLATRGFSALFDRPPLGGFFDAQARALLQGHWDVPPAAAAFERFRIDGRFYMYFGPTPALFRMPLLLVTHSLDGRLSRVSMIVASAVLVWAIARLAWLARRSVRGGRPVSRGEAAVAGALVFAASLGTAAVYITSWTAVYHEAIQWGVALALVSYGALLAWMLDARGRDLAVAGVAATLSVLARGSVGLGPVAAIGIVLLVRLVRAYRARGEGHAIDRRTIVWLGTACAVPIVLYAYVNQVKFGSPFSTPPWQRQDLLIDWPPRVAAMAANGGKLTGIEYAPTTLYHFFRPDGLAFDRLFPWVLPLVPHKVFGGVVFENFRPTASLTSTTPLALIAAVVGTWAAVARRALRRWLAPIAGAVIGSLGVFVFAWLDHRYQADFAPLLLVSGLLGAWVAVEWLAGRSRAVVGTVAAVAVLLAAWGVWANFGIAYVYQRAQPDWSTVDDRASLLLAQLRVADILGTPLASSVGTGDALPAGGDIGRLFVVGDCAGVYRFDGANWLAVEQTSPTGYDRLRVALAPDATGRQPVLSRADDLGTTIIWARNAPDDRVAFEYQWEPKPGITGGSRIDLGTVDRSADGTVDVSVRFDQRPNIAHFLQFRANGQLLYADNVTATYGLTEIGAQHAVPAATDFDGTVRDRGTATPLCDRLVDGGVHVARS
ncbi:MAG: hypothetical protein ACHQIG_02150 [Acidimicrobiia bacterium]